MCQTPCETRTEGNNHLGCRVEAKKNWEMLYGAHLSTSDGSMERLIFFRTGDRLRLFIVVNPTLWGRVCCQD